MPFPWTAAAIIATSLLGNKSGGSSGPNKLPGTPLSGTNQEENEAWKRFKIQNYGSENPAGFVGSVKTSALSKFHTERSNQQGIGAAPNFTSEDVLDTAEGFAERLYTPFEGPFTPDPNLGVLTDTAKQFMQGPLFQGWLNWDQATSDRLFKSTVFDPALRALTEPGGTLDVARAATQQATGGAGGVEAAVVGDIIGDFEAGAVQAKGEFEQAGRQFATQAVPAVLDSFRVLFGDEFAQKDLTFTRKIDELMRKDNAFAIGLEASLNYLELMVSTTLARTDQAFDVQKLEAEERMAKQQSNMALAGGVLSAIGSVVSGGMSAAATRGLSSSISGFGNQLSALSPGAETSGLNLSRFGSSVNLSNFWQSRGLSDPNDPNTLGTLKPLPWKTSTKPQ